MSIQDIIKRASGPDREIDLTIHLAVCPDGEIAQLMQYRRGLDGKEGMAWDIYYNGCIVFEKYNDSGQCIYNGGVPLPHYTDSIDAALTLIEEGWEYSISTLYNIAEVELRLNDTRIDPIIVRRRDGNVVLAFVTAALKARASISSKEQVKA